ncbi:MAG: hypothetical protein Ct9H300mP28_01840 [Pseudomonadota bacterium]|nr:MAG: hypothetical protein Ct9H300mP28_01840 [Pseudomonadota bacterium]
MIDTKTFRSARLLHTILPHFLPTRQSYHACKVLDVFDDLSNCIGLKPAHLTASSSGTLYHCITFRTHWSMVTAEPVGREVSLS